MAVKVGINGFGRIGRLVMRIGASDPNIEFVAINDLVPADNLAYLLKYDSSHGRFDGTVEAEKDAIIVNGKRVACYSERDPLSCRGANWMWITLSTAPVFSRILMVPVSISVPEPNG